MPTCDCSFYYEHGERSRKRERWFIFDQDGRNVVTGLPSKNAALREIATLTAAQAKKDRKANG